MKSYRTDSGTTIRQGSSGNKQFSTHTPTGSGMKETTYHYPSPEKREELREKQKPENDSGDKK
jgi:hypothetical protein